MTMQLIIEPADCLVNAAGTASLEEAAVGGRCIEITDC